MVTMDQNMIVVVAVEIISIACLNKKRKIQASLLEVPLQSKHFRWGPHNSGSSTEPLSSIPGKGSNIPETISESDVLEEVDHDLYHDYYGELVEFGNHGDKDNIDGSNLVVSWSDNQIQDDEEGIKKVLTIDNEFEEYFSMLRM